MLGFFRIFGRSPDLKALDQALQDNGLHPRAVPEAVKLTAVRLLKQAGRADTPLSEAACDDAAQLLGYCMLGHDQFIASNDIHAAAQAADRLDAAIAAGDSLDAKLLLLALHSGILVSDLAGRFDIETH